MTINDAKKVMLDKVNLEIDSVELGAEICEKEKQIKKLSMDVTEAECSYNELENSGVKKFFLGLTGKKEERIQEAQSEIRRTRGELTKAEFELESLKSKAEEIEQTRKEIENVCSECLNKIAEADGEEIKTKILAISEVPRLRAEIAERLKELKPLFTKAYDVYMVGEPTASCLDGNANNRGRAMRKHSKVIASGVDEIIQLLNTYNLYAPDEIKIEFYDKWMDKKDYWENQVLPADTMDRIKKVEKWFYALTNKWAVMQKQLKETMQIVQEDVLVYLDD